MLTLAICHGCKQAVTCAYCPLCDHWFCDDCRPKWLDRTKEAVNQLIYGRIDNCCGPLALDSLL